MNAANVGIQGIASAGAAMMVRNPGLARLLGLSNVAIFDDELRAAWEGNGRRSDRQDAAGIIAALVKYWARRNGLSEPAALDFVKRRHHRLFPGPNSEASGTVAANSVQLVPVGNGMQWQLMSNGSPVGKPASRESGIDLARTLDRSFKADEVDLVTLGHDNFFSAGNSTTVRPYVRRSPTGQPVAVGQHDRTDEYRRNEAMILEHDRLKHAAKSILEFKAHEASESAYALSDKSLQYGGKWNDEAAEAHQHAAEMHSDLGNKEIQQRHLRMVRFHEGRELVNSANAEPFVVNWCA